MNTLVFLCLGNGLLTVMLSSNLIISPIEFLIFFVLIGLYHGTRAIDQRKLLHLLNYTWLTNSAEKSNEHVYGFGDNIWISCMVPEKLNKCMDSACLFYEV